ncbi:MAG: hypothetical protein KC517_12290 [Bacteroidetes bacterium]|jgi:hypothetical protein|nr:hypothetical protein [Bacteroidota bacterium]
MSNTSNKKIIYITAVIILICGCTAAYFYYMPHRNVIGMSAEATIESTALVDEYLLDGMAANAKYLNEEGESAVLAVTGKVSSITTDQINQKVILLKGADAHAGVSCTFTEETNNQASNVKIGQSLTIKGVIRSGAGYDEDLELYEDVILEKCTIVKK